MHHTAYPVGIGSDLIKVSHTTLRGESPACGKSGGEVQQKGVEDLVQKRNSRQIGG